MMCPKYLKGPLDALTHSRHGEIELLLVAGDGGTFEGDHDMCRHCVSLVCENHKWLAVCHFSKLLLEPGLPEHKAVMMTPLHWA